MSVQQNTIAKMTVPWYYEYCKSMLLKFQFPWLLFKISIFFDSDLEEFFLTFSSPLAAWVMSLGIKTHKGLETTLKHLVLSLNLCVSENL